MAALASAVRGDQLAQLDKVTKDRKKIGGRLNRRISKTSGILLIGINLHDQHVLQRVWALRSKKRKLTFIVRVKKTLFKKGDLELDGEIERVLDSLAEDNQQRVGPRRTPCPWLRTMTRLVLIRHSHTKLEPEVSSHEWTLSSEGRARCACVGMVDQLQGTVDRIHPDGRVERIGQLPGVRKPK